MTVEDNLIGDLVAAFEQSGSRRFMLWKIEYRADGKQEAGERLH